MNSENLKYICNKLLEIDWEPKLTNESMQLLDKCDSKLEIMFLLGALHYLEQLCIRASNMCFGEFPITIGKVEHNGELFEGYYFYEVWPLWIEGIGLDCGPRTIMFVPQLTFSVKYHHDFGIFYGDYGEPKKLYLKYAIEIDGYQTHKNDRENDKYRDSLVEYPVIRFQEELHKPLTWFKILMQKDDDYFYETHCKES